jgi:hypothetical protein
VRDAGGHDDCLARSGHELLTGEREAGSACQDGEPFFLVRVDVLGDHPAGMLRQLKRTNCPPLSSARAV